MFPRNFLAFNSLIVIVLPSAPLHGFRRLQRICHPIFSLEDIIKTSGMGRSVPFLFFFFWKYFFLVCVCKVLSGFGSMLLKKLTSVAVDLCLFCICATVRSAPKMCYESESFFKRRHFLSSFLVFVRGMSVDVVASKCQWYSFFLLDLAHGVKTQKHKWLRGRRSIGHL